MSTSYQKASYDDLPGFCLRHTAGPDAAASTTGHLHMNASKMILYFIRGGGNLVVEDKAYPVHAGDMILTDSSELFHCSIQPHVYHERLCVHIDSRFFCAFPCQLSSVFRIFTERKKGEGNLIRAEAVKSSGLGVMMLELFALVQQDSPNRDILALSKLLQLLCVLDTLRSAAQPQAPSRDALLPQLLQYLNEHCTENISIPLVAAHFHITPSYLAHRFKKHTGISPWNYVILSRLQQANRLMEQGLSAEEACYQVGFDNYANFFRLYKKHLGISPSHFKKQLR